jgi:leucyl aminopeptidase
MKFSTSKQPIEQIKADCLVVAVWAKGKMSADAAALDQASAGHLAAILKKRDLDQNDGASLLLYQVPGVQAERLLLVNLGDPKKVVKDKLVGMLADAVRGLQAQSSTTVALGLSGLAPEASSDYLFARQTLLAIDAALYDSGQLKSERKLPKRPIKSLVLVGDDPQLAAAATDAQGIAQGVALARVLGDLPGNICTPAYLADQARQLASQHRKLQVTVLEEADMEKLKMGALLSVSRGSVQPAKLIVMQYQGGRKNQAPLALVGKGLTFDAGGISLKPGEAMDEMKYDMCGGAAVLGAFRAALELQLPINLLGVIPSSENLPDGNANKPGDIVTSMSGQTIEVLNTDAEGRLILCDALTYTEGFKPELVVDMATLTGACIVALGKQVSGLMGNDQELVDELLQAGEQAADRVWQLPIWEEYQAQLDSNFADMANIGGRPAGAITAACFLARFTKNMKWAHLDIAGTAWKSGKEKGATGRPVPLLMDFLLGRCRRP